MSGLSDPFYVQQVMAWVAFDRGARFARESGLEGPAVAVPGCISSGTMARPHRLRRLRQWPLEADPDSLDEGGYSVDRFTVRCRRILPH